MRRFMGILAAGLLCATAACTTPATTSSGGVSSAADVVVMSGTKAFALAEIAYTAAAQTVTAAANNNLISPDNATQLRGLNAKAKTALEKGYAATNDVERARQATELLGIVDQIKAIVGG